MIEQTANVLLGKAGPSDGFTLHYGIFKFHMKIKPISARNLIKISSELSKIRDIDKNKDMFQALMDGANDTKHIAMSIAIATGTRFKRFFASIIMNLPNEDISTLFKIVRKQSNPEPYFFFIISARGKMNLLTPAKDE